MAIGTVLKELAVAAGTAAVKGLIQLIRRKARDEWIDVKLSDPPPQPLRHVDVAEQQRQIDAASSHGVVQGPVNRNATTVRPGKSGKLPP